MDVHVRRLRAKLGPEHEHLIETVRSVGYRAADPDCAPSMPTRADVIVIGGGQAGLATSRELGLAGIDHLVLERDRIGASWAGLWDNFRLNTPNWSVKLPGLPYGGPKQDAFASRAEMVAHLERYRTEMDAPVLEGVEVHSPGAPRRRVRALHVGRSDVGAQRGGLHRRLPAGALPARDRRPARTRDDARHPCVSEPGDGARLATCSSWGAGDLDARSPRTWSTPVGR